ncbi:ribonuclease P protein component [Dyella sp. 2HG41-7]|uniref:ribonuclease P protein component n=1 Tax=Dyella sp. 2HG41-7 TaxID=2883239 RepID=UPI001F457F57|nr:ribonuclease P protein component [Dyella sp. 2HG41-7]
MGTAGLPREARIRRAGDFAVLRQDSGRLGSRCFSVRYRQNDLGHARLGLAISKRVSKLAVDRNRIKRLVRESFRRARHRLPPVDLMILAREQACNIAGPALLAELDALWRKLPPLKHDGDTSTMIR